IDAFFLGPFTSALEPTELVTEVRVPAPGPRAGGAYAKLERKVGDFATVGVAVHLTFDDGRLATAGIGLTGVGPTNLRAAEAEQALAGAQPGADTFAEAARLAAEAAAPHDDQRGSVEYKRNAVRVLTTRALQTAAASAA